MNTKSTHRIAALLAVSLFAAMLPPLAPAAGVSVTVATPSVTLRSVAMLDETTAVAVATNGTVWRTTSAGNDWTQVRTADSYDLRAVDFWNASSGVAVAYNGKAVKSVDGGVTWTNVDFSPYPDMDGDAAEYSHHAVACAPGTTSIAVSVGGDPAITDATWIGPIAMRTQNSLSNWKQPLFSAKAHLYNDGLGNLYPVGEGEFLDIDFVDGLNAWAAGRDTYTDATKAANTGAVYRSTDGGVSWTMLTTSLTSTLNAVAFGSTTAGVIAGQLVAGGAPRVFYTTNGGTSWVQGTLPTGAGVPRALHMTSATTGWLVGDGGTLLRTTDGGATWSACTKPSGFTSALYDVKLVGTKGIAVGSSAVLMTDDGVTWYRPDPTPPTISALWSTSHPLEASWYPTRAMTAFWSASDSSGVAGYAVVLDQSPTTVPEAVVTQTGTSYSTTLASDGVWYLHLRAVDTRGNWSSAVHRAFRADTVKPVTTSDAVAVYVDSATITLAPTDASPSSGIASTDWSIDGSIEGTGTTVHVDAEGDWTLRFSSVDTAGNREDEQSASFAVEIAPSTPEITSTSHPDPDEWSGDPDILASWSASDSSGIAGYGVVLDHAPSTVPDTVTQTASTVATTVADGEWYLHVRARDTRGNWGETAHRRFAVDSVLPIMGVIDSTTHPTQDAWYSARSFDASWIASDASGIAGYSVVLDQNATTRPPEVVTTTAEATAGVLPADGVWYLHVIALDNQGDWSAMQHRAFRADTVKPVTTSDAVTTYVDSATITLAPTDASPSSGIASTDWSIDGGTSGSGVTVVVSAEGDWTLRFSSVDTAGNREDEQSASFAVEIAPSTPEITSTSHPDPDEWSGDPNIAASWSASDSSGIAGYGVVLDHAPSTVPDTVTQTASTLATTVADGEWYLHVRARDARGNWGETAHRRFAVDTVKPVTTSNATTTYQGSATITLSPTDASPSSGIASTDWSIDGGTSGSGTTVVVSAEGDWTLRFSSVDAAGNREAERAASFAVEIAPSTPAVFSPSHPDPGEVYAGQVLSASWSASDSSGIAGYGVVLDRSATTVPASVTQTASTLTATVPRDATSYLHVRARDTRGNWSGTTHFAVSIAPLTVTPVAGDDRIATAVEASEEAFPAAGTASAVVIATAWNWPDALGGAALGGVADGPILLTNTATLPDGVRAEIERLKTLGADRAYILGGVAAVGPDVEAALNGLFGSTNVTRLAGANRYETARAVAGETVRLLGSAYDGTAFVATGANFPDALGASPLAAAKGWPLYLVNPVGVDDSLVSAMAGIGVTDLLVLGGEGAVSADIETALRARLGASAERLSGDDRYATALAVASYGVDRAGLTWDRVAVATGANFPDALAGGVLQARDISGRPGSVMLLTRPDALYDGAATTLSAKRYTIGEVRFLGGTGAVSEAVRSAVIAALE